MAPAPPKPSPRTLTVADAAGAAGAALAPEPEQTGVTADAAVTAGGIACRNPGHISAGAAEAGIADPESARTTRAAVTAGGNGGTG